MYQFVNFFITNDGDVFHEKMGGNFTRQKCAIRSSDHAFYLIHGGPTMPVSEIGGATHTRSRMRAETTKIDVIRQVSPSKLGLPQTKG